MVHVRTGATAGPDTVGDVGQPSLPACVKGDLVLTAVSLKDLPPLRDNRGIQVFDLRLCPDGRFTWLGGDADCISVSMTSFQC